MTEEDLDKKLEDFRGVSKEIDQKTSKTVGKLFVEDENSQVSADNSTYRKLFALVGGPVPVVIFVLYA